MWKIAKEYCMGCAVCTMQCSGIQMVDGYAEIVDQSATCLERAAQVCPRQIIQKV
ncbi:MAG: hypothetical protein K9W44_17015 [Candidatus Lokiarchaeota archaeon]|nr:hypothetical protein [Candidatus Harpocratesius repetitus]